MVKKIAEKTAGIDMSGYKPRSKAGVVDGQPPPTDGQTIADRGARKDGKQFTGVGAFMNSMTGRDEAAKSLSAAQDDLAEANRKLEAFDGAILGKQLDPKRVKRSQWANRDEAEFLTEEFRELKAEIANAGGNVQPIKVRAMKVVDGQPPEYEIAFGHRRHRACLELGLLVNALVVEEMTDRELFEEMERENRGRKNLSAWEQGRMYEDALKKGLYTSARNLEESLGINHSDVVRSLQLAKLPREVVGAFATPLDLQFRWAKPLTDALQRDPDGVLAAAREAGKQRGGLGAVEVFELLIGKNSRPALNEIPISTAGARVATFKLGPKGRAVVEFEAGALPVERHAALAKLIEDFMRL